MNRFKAAFALLAAHLAIMALAEAVQAQFTFSNYFELRFGENPDTGFDFDKNERFRFDQFSIDSYHGDFRAGLRLETFDRSVASQFDFTEITHRYVDWNNHGFDVRVGNFQELFGRGLVLRAFELTGVIREEQGFIFGDSRDLDGARLSYRNSRFEVVALGGQPRFADEAPQLARRSQDLLGFMASARIVDGVKLGAEYVHLPRESDRDIQLPGGFLQLSFDPYLRNRGWDKISADSYVEYARARGFDAGSSGSGNIRRDRGRALYLSQNLFIRDVLPKTRAAFSWEYKDYQNFEWLINEPPQLVREHHYALLNRNTHVVDAGQEEGYQFETRLHYDQYAELILNWSRAENRNSRQFKEFYAELVGHWRSYKLSLFAGDSQDGSELIFDRRTYGTYGQVPFLQRHSLTLEYEQMTALRRVGNSDLHFQDNYVSLTYALAGIFSLSGIRQTTNDPFDVSDGRRKAFDALTASVSIGNHHEILGFWGRRRSGLLCTAGTCYLLPEFDGVTLQVLSRF